MWSVEYEIRGDRRERTFFYLRNLGRFLVDASRSPFFELIKITNLTA